MKRTLLLIIMCLVIGSSQAQELNAKVQLLAPTVSNLNQRNLKVLQELMRNFLNNNKWSAENYLPQERIACNLVITITAWDGGAGYQAEAQIQSSRPVYGTTFTSTLLNLNDRDFNFNYTEGQPLDFSDQNFLNNLSSILGFYAYTIIGMDKDSFSRLAGTPFYQKAQNTLNIAQTSGNAGWKASDGLRNRYWLNENLLNNGYEPLRLFIYDYHSMGLDRLANDQANAEINLFKSLTALSNFDKQKIGAYLPNLFFSGKSEELANVFSNFNTVQKRRAFDLLSVIDPANAAQYEVLKKP
jgi:hypothetical protein